MAYDHGVYDEKYVLPASDVGAGAKSMTFYGPKGKKGRVLDMGVQAVTEAFTATTLPAYISVGLTGNVDAYAEEFSMATTAIGPGISLRQTYDKDNLNIGGSYIVAEIPADTAVLLTATAPTGGTPAGIGDVFCIIRWDN